MKYKPYHSVLCLRNFKRLRFYVMSSVVGFYFSFYDDVLVHTLDLHTTKSFLVKMFLCLISVMVMYCDLN